MADDAASRQLPDDPLLGVLVDDLRARYGCAVAGILMYGSALRSGQLLEGLVDLYVVVEDYGVYNSRALALANRVLCPNVFYAEVHRRDATLRCKYAVISRASLQRAVSRTFESYFWGRFAQPLKLLYARDSAEERFLEEQLAAARRRFIESTLPAARDGDGLEEFWAGALALSYRTELRAEGPGRARELVAANRGFYLEVARQWTRDNPGLMTLQYRNGQWYCHTAFSPRQRRWARLCWRLRVPWGKFLSLCRLAKGLFTFDGGLDYIAWKLERHTGQPVEIPDRVRRRPLIYVWPLAWRLYRRGIFR